MKKELEDKIFKDFPKMFPSGRNVNPQESLICFGLGVNDGWYELIYNLCSCIQNYIDLNNKHQIIVEQVKEKFGGLRFYTRGGDELIHGMIWSAEHYSYSICEDCGEKGKPNDNGWIKTQCDECRNKDAIIQELRRLDFLERMKDGN